MLKVDQNRRLLALVPLTTATLASSLYLTRSGLAGDWVAVPVAIALWLPLVLLLDRLIVVERRGFWCRQCGYDLRGQTNAQCPECGRSFDSNETAHMALPDPANTANRTAGKRSYTKLVIVSVLVIALAASALLATRMYRTKMSPGTTAPPVQIAPVAP